MCFDILWWYISYFTKMQYLCPLSHWSKTSKKVYLQFLKPRLKTRTVRSKLSTTVTKKKTKRQKKTKRKQILLASCESCVRVETVFFMWAVTVWLCRLRFICYNWKKNGFSQRRWTDVSPTTRRRPGWCCAATEGFCQSCWICIKSQKFNLSKLVWFLPSTLVFISRRNCQVIYLFRS